MFHSMFVGGETHHSHVVCKFYEVTGGPVLSVNVNYREEGAHWDREGRPHVPSSSGFLFFCLLCKSLLMRSSLHPFFLRAVAHLTVASPNLSLYSLEMMLLNMFSLRTTFPFKA